MRCSCATSPSIYTCRPQQDVPPKGPPEGAQSGPDSVGEHEPGHRCDGYGTHRFPWPVPIQSRPEADVRVGRPEPRATGQGCVPEDSNPGAGGRGWGRGSGHGNNRARDKPEVGVHKAGRGNCPVRHRRRSMGGSSASGVIGQLSGPRCSAASVRNESSLAPCRATHQKSARDSCGRAPGRRPPSPRRRPGSPTADPRHRRARGW